MRTGIMLLAMSAGVVGSAINPIQEPSQIKLAVPAVRSNLADQLAVSSPLPGGPIPRQATIDAVGQLDLKCSQLEAKIAATDKLLASADMKLAEQAKLITALDAKIKALETKCQQCQPITTNIVTQPTAAPIGNSTVVTYPPSYQPPLMMAPPLPMGWANQGVGIPMGPPMMQTTCSGPSCSSCWGN